MALFGFYNPELSKRFSILDHLESVVVSQELSSDAVQALLNFYNERQMGSRVVIESLLARHQSLA